MGDEKIEFNLANLMNSPSVKDSCCRVDIINQCVKECSLGSFSHDGLEACLIGIKNNKDLLRNH